jgi:hypothetical protein
MPQCASHNVHCRWTVCGIGGAYLHKTATTLRRFVRWNTRGFLHMRKLELLDRKGEFELVDGLVLRRESCAARCLRI